MQSRRRPNSDRSLESLESRLRALPHPAVPRDLEGRILAAILARATASHEVPRLARASRHRRLVVWTSASLAMAAVCLLAVRFWPEAANQNTAHIVVANSETTEPVPQVTPRQPDNSRRILPCFEAQLDLDETETPTFTWPIREKSSLIVSTVLPPDLFD
jgi:hypothetical protein